MLFMARGWNGADNNYAVATVVEVSTEATCAATIITAHAERCAGGLPARRLITGC